MKQQIKNIVSLLSSFIANLPLLIANFILGALAVVVLFFMMRVSINYFYQPLFGNPKLLPENEASIDPKLLKEIQRRIDESKRAKEIPQNSSLNDPFD